MNTVIISAAKRTPIGRFQGSLSGITAPQLGSVAIKSVIATTTTTIDEVYMGCVLSAGLGQAPARQASLSANISKSTPCTTINKMCGSGMQSIITAYDRILLGHANIVVAGGMESMSNAPYLLPKMRTGVRMGHQQVIDHMFVDGLEDAYDNGRLMGVYAEKCATEFKFSRQQQDTFAIKSLNLALDAQHEGHFTSEICAVGFGNKTQHYELNEDEQPKLAKIDKIHALKPAFKENGTVTAANSSSISDGAAALTLMNEEAAMFINAPILARIIGQSTIATDPELFTIAPTIAANKLMSELNWKTDDVDLWEVNEAFAVVAMAFMEIIDVPRNKLNIRGGACALGHPIGASGARIVVTLIHALRANNLRRGVATICIGGGEATAIAIEIPE